MNEILCVPCSSEKKQVLADFFCKTCDDPEPLCEDCAYQHAKQKLSRNHELCDDLKEMPERYKKRNFDSNSGRLKYA